MDGKKKRKLKIRDIIVGNVYGFINGNNETELFIAQDMILSEDGWIISSESGLELNLRDIVQVEINHAILRSFGFNHDVKSFKRRFKGVGTIEIMVNDKIGNLYFVDLYTDIFYDSIISPFYVKYVNELQNRIYDLTGEVLTMSLAENS